MVEVKARQVGRTAPPSAYWRSRLIRTRVGRRLTVSAMSFQLLKTVRAGCGLAGQLAPRGRTEAEMLNRSRPTRGSAMTGELKLTWDNMSDCSSRAIKDDGLTE